MLEQVRAVKKRAEQLAGMPLIPSRGRGRRRQELRLRPGRLAVLLRGHKVEEVLQRTIVALMGTRTWEVWFNELNIAGGLGGGVAFNRVAVDLGRVTRGDPADKRCLDLFELKDWEGADPPAAAANQLLEYGCLFWALVRRRVSPYQNLREKLQAVRLAVMAPAAYYQRFGCVAEAAAGLFARVHEGLEQVKAGCPELAPLSFMPIPVVLPRTFGKGAFLDCFDRQRASELIGRGQTVNSPLEVLRPDRIPLLRSWVEQALRDAGL
jgi:hypothetical protein